MPQILVRNLEQDIKDRLKRRATRHGRSMEEEVRDILRAAVCTEETSEVPALGSRLAAKFAGLGWDESVEELRGENAQPANFGS